MHRGDLADLTAFVAVADELSFRAAAARVGVTPSALSHAMRQLEERLGVRLLHRTTRSVALTDQGQRLLERLRPAITQIAAALEDLDRERRQPSGRLRIHASAGAAAAAIAPVWDRFLAAYPDVHLELQVDDAPVDIVAKGFDAAIGIRERAAVDMVAVRVTGPMKVTVVGAPAYFARRPAPRTPDDLAQHSCIQYRWGDGVFVWPFQRSGQSQRISVRGPVTVNSPHLKRSRFEMFPCERALTISSRFARASSASFRRRFDSLLERYMVAPCGKRNLAARMFDPASRVSKVRRSTD